MVHFGLTAHGISTLYKAQEWSITITTSEQSVEHFPTWKRATRKPLQRFSMLSLRWLDGCPCHSTFCELVFAPTFPGVIWCTMWIRLAWREEFGFVVAFPTSPTTASPSNNPARKAFLAVNSFRSMAAEAMSC